MQKQKKIIAAAILLLGVAACMLFFLRGGTPSSVKEPLAPLQVTLFKIGKADAIVVQNGDKTAIIDAGEEEDGEEVVTFLKDQGISYVDTLIITHFDKDHVGGAGTLIEELEIGQVLIPNYKGSNTEYSDFLSAMKKKEITPQALTESVEFTLGEANVLVEPPLSYEIPEGEAEYDNNFSLITTITHGENRLLFAGDIEKQRIREWLAEGNAVKCNFLKVPHHGVYNKALPELMDAVAPKYAVICDSDKNQAEAKTLELLRQVNAQVLETRNGDVTVISDGLDLEVSQ